MAAGKLIMNKASGGVLNVTSTDGTTTTSLVLPAINGTVVAADSNGNVGIGVIPVTGEKLQVKTGANRNLGISDQTTITGAVTIEGIDDTRGSNIPLEVRGSTVSITRPTGTTAVFDLAGNVGIGVIPSAWSASVSSKVIQLGYSTSIASLYAGTFYNNAFLGLTTNSYVDASAVPRYIANSYATQYTQSVGAHYWQVAPSGTAGNAVTWTQAMTIENNTHTTIGSPVTSYTTGAQLRVEQAANNDASTASLIISRYSDNYSSALWHCYNATYNQEAFNLSVSPAGGGSSLTTSYKKYMALGNGNHFWYGATTSNQTMILDSNGQLTITPSSSTNGVKVQANTTTGVSFWTNNTQSGSTGWYHFYGTSANNTHADIAIYGNGNVVNANNSYGAISDIKLKENIVDTSPKLDKLMQVRVVNYNLIGDTQKQIGVIAQEIEKIFPSVVDETKDTKQVQVEKEREITLEDGTVEVEKYTETETVETGEVTKNVKYSVIYMMMLKAMQEQNEIIKDLKSRIEILEAK